jgi:hypothetical protein
MAFLTSDSEMLTALLPIRAAQNSFWSSSKGMDGIEKFLNTFRSMSEIDQFVVITQDDPVCRLADQQAMQISNIAITGNPDRPYTFEQTRSLARNFRNFCKHQSDALIVADHRNMFLTVTDISKFHKACKQHPEKIVVSLTLCRDYPCQFKAFFTFLGCAIIRMNEFSAQSVITNKLRIDHPSAPICRSDNAATILTSVFLDGSHCRISIRTRDLPEKNVIAQIIPFNRNGPQYEKSREIFFQLPCLEIKLEIDPEFLEGVMVMFTMRSRFGEYDTMELFSPKNAPWELGESASSVFSKKNNKPMNGRQQFPPSYTYDGSLCTLRAGHLVDKTIANLFPVILEDSYIIADWVDYWYTVTSQQNNGESKFEHHAPNLDKS